MISAPLTAAFSHLCSQGRSFLISGETLPVCERCFGLYAAAAITGTCLLIRRTWRVGLPTRGKACLHSAMLLTAMLGGLHLIDTGPTWRLLCGLWTGHVAIIWLVTGTAALSRPLLPSIVPEHRVESLAGWSAPPLYVLGASIFARANPPTWWLWSGLIVYGSLLLLICLMAAIAMLAVRILARPQT